MAIRAATTEDAAAMAAIFGAAARAVRTGFLGEAALSALAQAERGLAGAG